MVSRRSFLKSAATLPLFGGPALARDNLSAPDVLAALSPPNPKIQAARTVALGLLQPTATQLKHGMRLHADSLVCEPYGFAPQCAIDGEAFQNAVEAGASDQELQDLREEMRMTRCTIDPQQRDEFFEAFRASGVTCIFQNAGEEGNDPQRLIRRLANHTFTTDVLRERLFKAVTPEDILTARRTGRLCLYMTTNGVPLTQRWENVRDELGLIRLFFRLGVRAMHLTYNRRNPLGDGAGEPGDGGISDFGRAAIREMNRVGVIVDVAHSGWRTSLEAAKASSKPVMASHTTCAGVYRHIRSKPDEVLKAICDTGGLFGICVLPQFLGGTGDIKAFLDHLDYAIKKFGSEHVAISTDVAYRSQLDTAEIAKVRSRNGRSPLAVLTSRWEKLWPPDEYRPPSIQAAQSTAWTNWPLFTVGLVQRGHSDETIRRVLGENVLRVARDCFPKQVGA
jgi:membrane dipeptidase